MTNSIQELQDAKVIFVIGSNTTEAHPIIALRIKAAVTKHGANLIVADGVLNAPDYTRTCTCSYQNQTSLAMIHDPSAEMWTFNDLPWDGKPVRRVGINFGAPGDRRADDGTLWLDWPSVGGPSGKAVETSPKPHGSWESTE